jgi:acyl-CoA thioesterase-1
VEYIHAEAARLGPGGSKAEEIRMVFQGWRSALAMVCITSTTLCAQAPAAAKPKPPPDPSLALIQDQPGLPRVLLIGDSISMGYTLPVRELLAGQANVHRIPTNGAHTERGVADLSKWLGEGRWDVIHFNWGLHDLKRNEDDKHQIPITEYEANLRALVTQLKATGATLIWCATTPVPAGDLQPPRRDADVIAYNAAAARIMAENSIAIDDLYAFALPRLHEIQQPVNVHFTAAGYRALAGEVAQVIATALDARAKKP